MRLDEMKIALQFTNSGLKESKLKMEVEQEVEAAFAASGNSHRFHAAAQIVETQWHY